MASNTVCQVMICIFEQKRNIQLFSIKFKCNPALQAVSKPQEYLTTLNQSKCKVSRCHLHYWWEKEYDKVLHLV